MPVSRKRNNRGKGKGAREHRRRVQQHNDAVRERHRYDVPHDKDFAALVLLGAIAGLRRS